MKHNELVDVLLAYGWQMHLSRLKFMSMLLVGLIEAQSVNLKQVVKQIYTEAAQGSKYRRAQRFMSEMKVNQLSLIAFILNLYPQKTYRLAVDRTNWQFGKQNINILMIAIVTESNVAIPLVFDLLPKKGNSNTQERIDLLKTVLKVLKPEQIEVFLADREFISQTWFAFLEQLKIPFVIRIKQNMLADEWFRLAGFFQNLDPGQHKVLQHRYLIASLNLAVAAARSSDGNLVIIVTNRKPSTALKNYAQRWQIESLFKALKSSGFQLEDTHLKDLKRIKTLLALVTIAFTWALLVGQWQHSIKPIPIKSHGRKEVSVFRYGLDFLHQAFLDLPFDPSRLLQALRFLSCT